MSFPTKEDRTKCWNHRDEYWKCLDEKSDTECAEFRKQYEKFCPAQWVKHFDRKRDYLKFKEQVEKGGTHSLEERSNRPERSDVPVKLTAQSVLDIQAKNTDLCN